MPVGGFVVRSVQNWLICVALTVFTICWTRGSASSSPAAASGGAGASEGVSLGSDTGSCGTRERNTCARSNASKVVRGGTRSRIQFFSPRRTVPIDSRARRFESGRRPTTR